MGHSGTPEVLCPCLRSGSHRGFDLALTCQGIDTGLLKVSCCVLQKDVGGESFESCRVQGLGTSKIPGDRSDWDLGNLDALSHSSRPQASPVAYEMALKSSQASMGCSGTPVVLCPCLRSGVPPWIWLGSKLSMHGHRTSGGVLLCLLCFHIVADGCTQIHTQNDFICCWVKTSHNMWRLQFDLFF